MATQRKHQPRSRRSGRLFHLYIALSMLLIVAAVSAGSMVFFKVHQFEVTGNGRYSDDALLEASGIQDGDNLVRIPRH
jgi:cell division protein FtsQ